MINPIKLSPLPLLLAMAVGATGGTLVTSAVYTAKVAVIEKTHSDSIASNERAGRDAALASLQSERRLSLATARADALYKELENERNKATDLAVRLSSSGSGAIRVRVPAKCPAPATAADTSTAGLGDGAAGAELDPAVAAALARIADDGDRAIIKMTALQVYADSLQQLQKQKGPDDGQPE